MTSFNKKVVVIIPAFNEGETIGRVISEVNQRNYDVIVVDDGSTDQTSQVAKELGATVVRHPANKGYEIALSAGLSAAADMRFEIAITFDADGQFNPDDLLLFTQRQKLEGSDLVIGVRNRFNRNIEYALRLYGSYRFSILDPLCGLKLYRLSSISSLMPFDRLNLAGMEMAFKIAVSGGKISQIPIEVMDREDVSRFGSALIGTLKLMRVLIVAIKVFGLRRSVHDQ